MKIAPSHIQDKLILIGICENLLEGTAAGMMREEELSLKDHYGTGGKKEHRQYCPDACRTYHGLPQEAAGRDDVLCPADSWTRFSAAGRFGGPPIGKGLPMTRMMGTDNHAFSIGKDRKNPACPSEDMEGGDDCWISPGWSTDKVAGTTHQKVIGR
ncbi:MAG: hypothetical protein V1736_07510 [Pseudomonadota bacterium]